MEKVPFPYNATVAYSGRGIEILRVIDRIDRLKGQYIWPTRRYRRLERLREIVMNHAKWFFGKRYDMPLMNWEKFRGGYVFYNTYDYKQNQEKNKQQKLNGTYKD